MYLSLYIFGSLIMCIQARERAEIKMSNGGLSDHLCLVAATIVGILFVSLTYQRICVAAETQDYTESRQFRKNLAVSKYRNNTHWLPNYNWKPPEKFDGPRKKPAWEVEEVIESEADKKKREEYEEWERKMREVTRQEREKWRNNEVTQTSESPEEVIKQLVDPQEGETSRIKVPFDDKVNDRKDISNGLKSGLHNSRWGMSVGEPAKEVSKETSKTLQPLSRRRFLEQPTVQPDKPNSSSKEILAKLLNRFPKRPEVDEPKPNSSFEEILAKPLNRLPKRPEVHRRYDSSEFNDDGRMTNQWETKEDVLSRLSEEPINDYSSLGQSSDEEHSIDSTSSKEDHWTISSREPMKEFLQDTSKWTGKSPSRTDKRNQNPRLSGSEKIHGVEEDRGENGNTLTKRAFKKLPNGLPNGRLDMSEGLPLREFLREIPRHAHAGTPGFHESRTLGRFIGDRKADNGYRSRKLIFSRIPTKSKSFINPSDVFGLFFRNHPDLGVPKILKCNL